MRFLRLYLRGLKDAYDQFVLVMVVSVLWWICAVLIVPGPPATVALFRFMDPRNQVASPEIRDFFRTMREHFATAWAIAGLTVPLIAILVWNSLFFQGGDTFFTLMVPLWAVMVAIIITLMLFAFATVAAMDSKVRNAFRGATYLLVMWPFSSVLTIIFLAAFSSILLVLILPMLLFGPGVSAAVINRFVLAGYDVEIIDPNSPTQERRHEVQRGIATEKGIGGWMQRVRGDARKGHGRR